jgi:hypothetical protein
VTVTMSFQRRIAVRRRHSLRSRLRTLANKRRLLSIAAVLLCLCISSSTASAYFGGAYLYGDDFHGSHLFLEYHQNLFAWNWTQTFVKTASWVLSGAYWIEAGIMSGSVFQDDCIIQPPSATPYFYWADDRPNDGGYNCHIDAGLPPAQPNTQYGTTIFLVDPDTWVIGVGPLSGKSTDSIPYGTKIQTGTDENSQNSYSCSDSTDMGWYDSNDDLKTGWSDSSHGQARLWQARPPYAYWPEASNYTWVRYYAKYDRSCY